LGEKMAKTKSQVVVEGFLLDFNVPSEDLLNISIDVTGIRDFKRRYLLFRDEFLELLHEIDVAYAKRTNLRGRGVKASYSRLITGKRTKHPTVWRFSPHPSRFANALRTVRRKWYESLAMNTVVISRTAVRNVYLLPFEKAPDLMVNKQKLNNEIADLQMNIKAHEQTDYYRKVMDFVNEKMGIKFEPNPARLHGIVLSLHPLRLHPKVFEEFLAERWKEAVKDMDDEKQRGLSEIQTELERTRRELVQRSIEDLQTRLGETMKYLTTVAALKLTGKEAERLKGKIKDVQSLAESVGVGWCIQRITETNLKLVEAVTKKNKKAIQEASDAVAKEIGIPPSRKPEETLKRATIALTEKASPRLKALMEEML